MVRGGVVLGRHGRLHDLLTGGAHGMCRPRRVFCNDGDATGQCRLMNGFSGAICMLGGGAAICVMGGSAAICMVGGGGGVM